MRNILDWLDINDLVKPKRAFRDTGNGITYTTIAFALGLRVPVLSPVDDLWYKPGVLMRTPENTYGQESHDNYFSYALLSLMIRNPFGPRIVLKAAIKRLGFMYNINPFSREVSWKERGDGVMIRFLNVWALMIAAAFPNKVVKYLSRQLLKLWYSASLKFQPTNYGNASGTQLTWLGLYAIGELGDKEPLKAFLKTMYSDGFSMAEVMRRASYWDTNHPVLSNYTLFEQFMLGNTYEEKTID